MSESAEQRRYLLDVMQRTGWSQTELAARARLDPSTLSRFLLGQREGRAMRASSIRKIEQVSGLGFESGQPLPSAAQTLAEGLSEPDALPLDVPARSHLEAIIAALSQRGRNVDPWSLRGRALENAGYRPGDILLVALGETALAGDVVCAQVYDWPSGKAETVFRIFQPPYLLAASSDPTLMRPLVLDGETVEIKGVVINSIRDRGGHQ